MKKWTNLLFISFTFLLVSCVMNAKPESGENKTAAKGEVIVLDKASFLTKVYNYEKNQNEWVYEGDKPCIIDFYADWCGPCKMMAPIVEALSEELSDVKVCHINIDENIDIAQKYRVMSIPTFIAFKGGEESGRQIGAIPKTALVDLVK